MEKSTVVTDSNQIQGTLGEAMHRLMTRLFPICRSITGDGVRETLRILGKFIPLKTYEVPSGTQVFDWTVPDEWNVRDAYVMDAAGNRVIDFRTSNLHLVNYSVPFEGRLSLDELQAHLHSLPELPDLTPYVASYYTPRWGFCLPHRDRQSLPAGEYEVVVDSSLEPGALTYADLVIPGDSDEEIMLSTYVCHPSMANNELSGPVVATYLADYLRKLHVRRYTYRFVFIPETIGAITYLSRHLPHLQSAVRAGYVMTCLGDSGHFSYLQTRQENELVDRVTLHVLRHLDPDYRLYDFTQRGSDERQYCAPGVDLPVGSLMRTKYIEFEEYHTSADNLEFVRPQALEGSLEMYIRCVEVLERNRTYRTTVLGEPQMGKRDLYPDLTIRGSGRSVRGMMDVLAYCDGRRDLVDLAEKLGRPVWDLYKPVETLLRHDLLALVE